jgi:hypothetical protein
LKTFLLTKILIASLIGFLISISHVQSFGRSKATPVKQLLSIQSAWPSLLDGRLHLGADILDDDEEDTDEPVQQRPADNLIVTNFRPFLCIPPWLQEDLTSIASRCILIHCLKI